MPELSRRPYLLRAMVEWMVDSGHTPHAIVDATVDGVEVPRAFVNDGRIVLNISASATQALVISGDQMSFNARFSGVVHHVQVPIHAVLGVYARETGKGMVFEEESDSPPSTEPPTEPSPHSPSSAPATPRGGPTKGKRPSLKVVK